MKTVSGSCTVNSQQAGDSVRIAARFTMKPDPNMKSIIGQTAHNLDEVRLPPWQGLMAAALLSRQQQRSQLQGHTAPLYRQEDGRYSHRFADEAQPGEPAMLSCEKYIVACTLML